MAYSSHTRAAHEHNPPVKKLLRTCLDEHPEEATLALVALGSEANALQVLDAYPADDAFIEEILQHLQPSLVANIGGSLSYSEQTAFVEDAERLAQSLSSRKPGT